MLVTGLATGRRCVLPVMLLRRALTATRAAACLLNTCDSGIGWYDRAGVIAEESARCLLNGYGRHGPARAGFRQRDRRLARPRKS